MSRRVSESKLIMNTNPQSPVADAYRTLKTNIQFAKWEDTLQVIAVTSTLPGEGKTTTITNLAVSYAQEGKNVLLIDADMRHPSVHRAFNLPNKLGLSNILVNQYSLTEVIKDSYIDHLSIMTAGPIPPNPSELLSSVYLGKMLEELRGKYDIILFDTPPTLAVADGLKVAALSDGIVLVVQVGKVKWQLVKKTKAKLEHVNAEILGVVLNNQRKHKPEYQYN